MGLSSLPAPSEGVLCILLMNTALSFSIFKGLLRAILHIIGVGISAAPAAAPPPQSTAAQSQPATSAARPKYSAASCVTELFRSRVPTVRFGEIDRRDHVDGCSVCLTEFESESEINHVACGHVFHRVCLEKWLDVNRWSITCPLCRTPLMIMMPEEHPSYSFGYTFDEEEEEEDY